MTTDVESLKIESYTYDIRDEHESANISMSSSYLFDHNGPWLDFRSS